MDDDFNTPVAVAVLFDLASEVNRTRSPRRPALLKGAGRDAGLLQQAPRSLSAGGQRLDEATHRQRDRRARRGQGRRATSRAPTRSARNWPAQGIVLQDSPQGTTWVRGLSACPGKPGSTPGYWDDACRHLAQA